MNTVTVQLLKPDNVLHVKSYHKSQRQDAQEDDMYVDSSDKGHSN